MSDRTTHQVLAGLYAFVAQHEVTPTYPTEMRLIADTLDALQDRRDAMFRDRCIAIEAMFAKPEPVTAERREAIIADIKRTINEVAPT